MVQLYSCKAMSVLYLLGLTGRRKLNNHIYHLSPSLSQTTSGRRGMPRLTSFVPLRRYHTHVILIRLVACTSRKRSWHPSKDSSVKLCVRAKSCTSWETAYLASARS